MRTDIIRDGSIVEWLKTWLTDQMVYSSIPETTNFLTNSLLGQATNAHVSLFTKQYKLVPASLWLAEGETL